MALNATFPIFHLGANQSTCRGGPAWKKTLKHTVPRWSGKTDTEQYG